MHTTEQALNLWCPMVRASNGSDHPRNSGNSQAYRNPMDARCIADRCAMWRWRQSINDVSLTRYGCRDPLAETEPHRPDGLNPTFEFVPHDPGEGNEACWIEPLASQQARRRGFCGLAGRPEFT